MQQAGDDKGRNGLLPKVRLISVPVYGYATPSRTATVVVVAAAFIALSVLFSLGAWLYLSRYDNRVATSAPSSQLAALNQEAEALQRKVVDLVSGSVEAKLQAVEASIRQGHVTAEDLRTLDELRQELKILASYGVSGAQLASDPMLIRGGIPQAALVPGQVQPAEDLAFVKGLFYFSIASAGIAGLVASSHWLNGSRRHRRLVRGTPVARRSLGPIQRAGEDP